MFVAVHRLRVQVPADPVVIAVRYARELMDQQLQANAL